MSKANELLTKMLEQAITAMENGANFLGEQVPLVIQELLLFKTVVISVFLVLFLFITVFGIRLMFKGRAKEDKDYGYDPSGEYIIGAILSILGGIISMVLLYHWCLVVFAPRIYLIEYAASLIR